MARMIPDTIPDDAPESEKTIFENLKHSPHADGWTVFYSGHVKNPKHPLRQREIDFLIFMPEYCSIICLEAKGGYYTKFEGKWHNKSSGEVVQPSPPDQAGSAMFAFRTDYNNYFKHDSLLSLGCTVAFPDAKFTAPVGKALGVKIEGGLKMINKAMIMDRDIVNNPDRLGGMLATYADKMRLPKVKNKLENEGMDWERASHAIKDLELELATPIMITTESDKIFRRELDTLRQQLLRLTTEQERCLEQIQSEWNDRCVIAGAAGTGKTVLAMEFARHLCDEGKNVALLCSNPYLSSRFQRWTKKLSNENGGRVVAGTPATLPLEALIANEALRDEYQKRLNHSPKLEESLKPGSLDNAWGKFIKETIEDLGQVEASFDYLIVDEAQNLCDKVFLDLMDALLKGGLNEGRWTMFGDFEYQHILNMDGKDDKNENDGRKKLKTRGLDFSHNELKINCRNTHEIAAAFAMFADIVSPPISGVHGPIIQREFFKYENEEDELEELDGLLTRLVNDLQKRDFFSRQIILLANDNDDFGNAQQIAGWRLENIRDAIADKPLDSEKVVSVSGEFSTKILKCSDVYDFQGLESDVVILVMPLTKKQSVLGGGATMPDFEHLRRVLYTGMSRAKAMLIIVAHESYKEFLKLDSIHGRSYEDHIKLLRDECNRLT